ncbi:Protein CBG25651 [Caenorhabditis briggsae]|uniref:Protein CBG25651 n=1 Tax=Caenorhabditis briggsae TaxID=6238 RepID=B6IFD5_CAEBR|nr:Protein CBG25651 [Caenorhabditis briggsae]CAR98615.1 Protein CBG25651 [Caenorhabditis briggsae]
MKKVAKTKKKGKKCEELVRVVFDDRSTLTINLTRIITFDESPMDGSLEHERGRSKCNKNIKKTMIY